MSAAKKSPVVVPGTGGPLSRWVRLLLRVPQLELPLVTAPLPIADLDIPAAASAAPSPDDEAAAARLAPISNGDASPADLLQRLRDAVVQNGSHPPEPLADLLAREPRPQRLVVLAADREPQLSATSQLLCDRTADAARAAALLARIAGASEAHLALLAPLAATARASCAAHGVHLLELAPVYPQTLETLVATRVGGDALVIRLEAALAAVDAITAGRRHETKALTCIGPGGRVLGNYRVALGTRLRDLLAALDLEAGERDKVILGGPMRGRAQHSLAATLDASVDAVILQRADEITTWSDYPCINCGTCIDVCPARLQVQMIGRYAEFGKFAEAAAEGLAACCECGLCASACPARRPLLQLIRLARAELDAAAASTSAAIVPEEVSS